MSSPLRTDASSHHSSLKLVKATAIAAVAAGIILTVAVLPAEYGIDPTGIGTTLGLTGLHRPTAPSTTTSSTLTPPSSVTQRPAPFRSDTLRLTLQPKTGAEIKASMQASDGMVFSWTTDGGAVNFDMHGEPPHAGNDFTSYWKDQQQVSGHGTFLAPFAGTHGWYWGNRGTQPVTVTVTTSGFYEQIRKL